jgi:hypothetical protein
MKKITNKVKKEPLVKILRHILNKYVYNYFTKDNDDLNFVDTLD